LQKIHDSAIKNKEENVALSSENSLQEIDNNDLCEESSQEDSQTQVFKDSKIHSQKDDDY